MRKQARRQAEALRNFRLLMKSPKPPVPAKCPPGCLYGWFSLANAQKIGVYQYRKRHGGKIVDTTEVTNDPKPHSKSPDIRFIGFVRNYTGSKGFVRRVECGTKDVLVMTFNAVDGHDITYRKPQIGGGYLAWKFPGLV